MILTPLTSLVMGLIFMETVGAIYAMHDPWRIDGWLLVAIADTVCTFICVNTHSARGTAFALLPAYGAVVAINWIITLKRRGPPGGRA